jgi:23S rRNA pseudouridine1911/1915/1917 synthase
VEDAGGGERLDRYLAERVPSLSRARIQSLVGDGHVRLAGKPARPSARVRAGQEIEVFIPEAAPALPTPEPIPLDVVHEDRWLLVVDKPAGLVVHPGAGVSSGTLVNALLHRVPDLSGVGGVIRPGIVHRLDKGTSGLIVIAKDDRTHRSLAEAFAARRVEKEYRALVLGVPGSVEGRITAPIGRDPRERKKMSVRAPRARAARSDYRILEAFRGAALLGVRLHTGRTHQIRVHLASIGHPVAGDLVYGGERRLPPGLKEALSPLARPALHAARLAFLHPGTGEEVSFSSPLPADIEDAMRRLRSRPVS